MQYLWLFYFILFLIYYYSVRSHTFYFEGNKFKVGLEPYRKGSITGNSTKPWPTRGVPVQLPRPSVGQYVLRPLLIRRREEVTAQMINAKTYVGQRVSAMQSHANEVQLDYSESLKFSTPNYYKTMSGCGDSVYADSSSMFVCVYWGGVWFCWELYLSDFWRGSPRDCVSRSNSKNRLWHEWSLNQK